MNITGKHIRYIGIGLLLIAVSSIISKRLPAALFTIGLFAGLAWGAWRLLIFLREFLRPASKVIADKTNPVLTDLEEHLDKSLRSAGMGKIADLNRSLKSIINEAIGKINTAMDHSIKK